MAEPTVRTDGEVTDAASKAAASASRGDHGPRRRRRRRIIVVSTVLVVGAVAAVGWPAGWWDGGDPEPAATGVVGLDTAEVERGDLVRTESVEGELGYGDEVAVRSGTQGVVTALPAEGTTVGRGETLYEVDTKPVTLMIGATPMYRTLGPGDEGVDVEQLEDNLSRLGYTGFTVDDEYTQNTADAVEQWQDDRGLAETGRIDPGQIVFAASSVRVSSHTLAVGARVQPGAEVVSVTPTAQIVTIDLDVTDRELVTEDAAVTIDLPDGATVNGHIASIGTVATSTDSSSSEDQQSGDGNDDTTATIEVVVTLDDGESVGPYDQAPVGVNLESERTEDVLSVPVAALIATDDDQYAVEVIEGGTSQMVPVQIGAFAGGRVEVEGAGIEEGTLVGVPKS